MSLQVFLWGSSIEKGIFLYKTSWCKQKWPSSQAQLRSLQIYEGKQTPANRELWSQRQQPHQQATPTWPLVPLQPLWDCTVYQTRFAIFPSSKATFQLRSVFWLDFSHVPRQLSWVTTRWEKEAAPQDKNQAAGGRSTAQDSSRKYILLIVPPWHLALMIASVVSDVKDLRSQGPSIYQKVTLFTKQCSYRKAVYKAC